ncbi:MAG: metallophosphoesterase, partial [Sediminibacterium sp.]|nr:metallophosphoesterase [Sediminibacterium sp.]
MLLKYTIGCLFCLYMVPIKSQSPMLSQPADINTEIAFVSDTQSPLWLEQLFLKTNNNRNATKKIFNNIQERNPMALFLLGDVVSLGTSTRAWREIDKCLNGCRELGMKVYATLGNHEVMGTRTMGRKGQKKFLLHFPNHSLTGFVETIDYVAVILLNSNFSTLTKAE